MYQAKLFSVIPDIPPQLSRLRELAYNLWWTWNTDAAALFARLNRKLWGNLKHNPVRLLGKLDQNTLDAAANDAAFLAHMDRVLAALDAYLGRQTWCESEHPELTGKRIAYFSAEFGLHESIPTYSGGLGVLAGDHLKSASDLGVPLIGVTLLYRQGYFSQYLSNDGWQFEEYPILDLDHLPIEGVQDEQGNPLRVWVEIGDHSVVSRIWKITVGRAKLYLLDTDCPQNSAEDRSITTRLYAGDQEMRIKQELILGIGGFRALAAMGEVPDVCHINEGHSAFLSLERTRRLIQADELTFEEAREAVAASTVFTTHTPVPAGIDTFPTALTERYLKPFVEGMGVPIESLIQLGQGGSYSQHAPFSMAMLALSSARHSNGVSKIHGEVAREMWQSVWPGTPVEEIPIASVTNGVHMMSWLSQDMTRLFERYLGPHWADNPLDQSIWERITEIPDAELWRVHETLRGHLVVRTRQYVRVQRERRGAPPSQIAQADELLNPEALTIGFARRFAAYKRATLFLRDEARILRLLRDEEHPVQFVIAGKAHPRDNIGKELIKHIVQFARHEGVGHRLVFIENYDLDIARFLVQGVDVWLNNPVKPLEASGTSGMKVTPNGGINMSVLDGWWPEAYDGTNGWIIGDNRTHDSDEHQNYVESESIYELLEREIIPLFYDQGPDGLPRKWIARMKASMRTCVPQFSANRMVREYTEGMYIPSARRWDKLATDQFEAVRSLTAWKSKLRARWDKVKVESFETTNGAERVAGTELCVAAKVRLGDIAPKDVAVQLYYGSANADGVISQGRTVPMECDKPDGKGVYTYNGALRCESTGQHAYTVRVVPHHHDIHHPFEMGLVTWA
ncbi:MAG: alpha-glucan family phosphorylase [Phycisphaerae bacterium]|nr:alpha-glucan family phosphorylase [Phycisphaerae bacterium]